MMMQFIVSNIMIMEIRVLKDGIIKNIVGIEMHLHQLLLNILEMGQ